MYVILLKWFFYLKIGLGTEGLADETDLICMSCMALGVQCYISVDLLTPLIDLWLISF
jgi:hypothetical protein